jgi:RNA polymerase sigma factor (sigma-70 family)
MASASRGDVYQQIARLYGEGTLSGLGDGQLLDRYVKFQDEAAFEALVNLHGPMVFGLCRRLLRDPRDIEDAFQATFLILVRKAPTIRDRGLLSNWLFGVAYRVARRARTNTLRRRDREVAGANLEVPAPPQAAANLEFGPELDRELHRLPLKYRVPLILCYLEGHTHDEAAATINCPVGTVRSRLARGRDLLRRRLTSLGHAPTAAILAQSTAVPQSLKTEAVPPSLVAATVEAALRIGATKTIHAGAASASALALTQGVLATMKLAQWKTFALAILATGVSAGGVVAIAYAPRQDANNLQKPASETGKAAYPPGMFKADMRKPFVRTVPDTETRLNAIEQKLDQLLSRLNAAAAPAAATQPPGDPFQSAPASARSEMRSSNAIDANRRSLREIEVDLKLAMIADGQAQSLYDRRAISSAERELNRGRVLLIKAMLEGLDDELADDHDRLVLETKRKQKELDQAQSQKEVTLSVVARNHRLNERKPGVVNEFDVAKAEGELKSSAAAVAVKKVEMEEVQLRMRQLDRRREQIKDIVKLADRLKTNVPALAPTNGGERPQPK